MTETSPVTHLSPANKTQVKFGSVGPPAPNTECKIVDLATGEALGPNQGGRSLRAWAAGNEGLLESS